MRIKKLSGLATGELAIQQPIRGSNEKESANQAGPIQTAKQMSADHRNLKIFWGCVNADPLLFQKQILKYNYHNKTPDFTQKF